MFMLFFYNTNCFLVFFVLLVLFLVIFSPRNFFSRKFFYVHKSLYAIKKGSHKKLNSECLGRYNFNKSVIDLLKVSSIQRQRFYHTKSLSNKVLYTNQGNSILKLDANDFYYDLKRFFKQNENMSKATKADSISVENLSVEQLVSLFGSGFSEDKNNTFFFNAPLLFSFFYQNPKYWELLYRLLISLLCSQEQTGKILLSLGGQSYVTTKENVLNDINILQTPIEKIWQVHKQEGEKLILCDLKPKTLEIWLDLLSQKIGNAEYTSLLNYLYAKNMIEELLILTIPKYCPNLLYGIQFIYVPFDSTIEEEEQKKTTIGNICYAWEMSFSEIGKDSQQLAQKVCTISIFLKKNEIT